MKLTDRWMMMDEHPRVSTSSPVVFSLVTSHILMKHSLPWLLLNCATFHLHDHIDCHVVSLVIVIARSAFCHVFICTHRIPAGGEFRVQRG